MSNQYQMNVLPTQFGDKRILFDVSIHDLSNTLVIFFHGCCGTCYDLEQTTYQQLFIRLKDEVSCGIFESSRNLRKIDQQSQLTFSQFVQEAFKGKQFKDELMDARTVVKKFISDFKINKKKDPQLIFAGFSMGGWLALSLAAEFNVDDIFMFGTGANFVVEPDLPILGSEVERQYIAEQVLAKAREFNGRIHIIRGSADDVTTFEAAYNLWKAFINAKKRSLVEWLGVDHRFKLLNNQPESQLIQDIYHLLQSSYKL